MRIIVFGDGLLGTEIVKQTNWDFVSRKKDDIDFCKCETYIDYIKKYDAVLNCIGYTNTYSDEREKHYEINFKGVSMLSDICKTENKKLIHISTDYVYTNSVKNASETDLPLISENWYTYYKLMADEFIMSRNENYLICRCSFKPNPFPYDSAWLDLIGNFDYVDVISELIIKLIKKDQSGLFNVGTNLKSMYDLAVKTNPKVKPIYGPEYIPHNISMNLNKMKQCIQ
jgi:RmlD substrate binding domain